MPRNKPDILIEILSCRPVAYYPALARRVGGVTSAVMLSQLIYWSTTTTVIERDGWFYKSIQDMEAETGLTKIQQQNARNDLIIRNVIDAKLKGLPRVWWYRVDMDRLVKYLNSIGTVSHPMDNQPNVGTETNPTLERKPTQHWDDNQSNIETVTNSILGEEPTQHWDGLSSNLIGIKDYNNRLPENTTETTTTNTALPENYKWVVVGDQTSEENFNELDDALDSIGYFESERPTILQMVSKYKWTDGQAAYLIDTLRDQLGIERAGAVLRYRLSHDNPENYQRKQSFDSYLCPRCNTNPCSCEEN